MGAQGAAASGLSLASAGLKAAGDYESSRGTAAGDTYRAEELDRAAQYGELQASQTNAQATRNLSITLGHIDAVRAASRTDPSSPTGAAVRDFTEQVGTEDKGIKVDSLMAQAQQSESDAAYMRYASSRALLSGNIAMAGDIVSGISGAVKSATPS
jgi:hypothetical protein